MSETHMPKASRSRRSECIASPGLSLLDRRSWIKKSAAALTVLFTGSRMLAQEAPLHSTIDSMSSITGSPLDNRLLEPIAALLNAILEDSKPLRALQLGSMEPATRFTADRSEND